MDLSLFNYSLRKSVVHKIPVLIKFFFLCLISIFIFFDKFSVMQKESWIIVSGIGIVVFIFLLLSKISVKQIKPLLVIPLLCLLISILRMISFSLPENSLDKVYKFSFVYINITEGLEGLLYSLRFFITTIAALIFFSTSTSLQILSALEKLQSIIFFVFPFIRKLNLAKMISLTLSFIPLVFETWTKVSIACKSRNPIPENHKQSLVQSVRIIFQQFATTFSCLLSVAEIKRKAMLNRG